VKCLKQHYSLIILQRQTLNKGEGSGHWKELREHEKCMLASLHMIKVQFSSRPFQIVLTSNLIEQSR
jgi:hypothetical protein